MKQWFPQSAPWGTAYQAQPQPRALTWTVLALPCINALPGTQGGGNADPRAKSLPDSSSAGQGPWGLNLKNGEFAQSGEATQHPSSVCRHHITSTAHSGRDGEWWLVTSEASGKECHIPSSCVAKIRHKWLYQGVSRQKEKELLLCPGNHSGSFLILESQTRQGCYSLSVCCGEHAAWASETHYRIHRLDNRWLYISPRLTFPSLHNLVDHYSEFSEGLCCRLSEPCSTEGPRAAPVSTPPAVIKKPLLHWDKIESSLLFLEITSPPEDSPVSQGLREAISSYLILSETDTPKPDPTGKGVKNS